MYDGYAALEVGYQCIFDGKEIAQQCDASVQLNPEQIILPKAVLTFPRGEPGPVTNYKVWVRKTHFLALLQALEAK